MEDAGIDGTTPGSDSRIAAGDHVKIEGVCVYGMRLLGFPFKGKGFCGGTPVEKAIPDAAEHIDWGSGPVPSGPFHGTSDAGGPHLPFFGQAPHGICPVSIQP